MTNPLTFNNNEKFGVLGIRCLLDDQFPQEKEFSKDLWVTRGFPFSSIGSWKEMLGEFHFKSLMNAKLYIISKCSTHNPHGMDSENEKLKRNVHIIYEGLLLSGFFKSYDKQVFLTGSTINGNTQQAMISFEENPILIIGSPNEEIDLTRINRSIEIATALELFNESLRKGLYQRIYRSLQIFFNGLGNPDIGERLHQFVRCIEGFVFPEQGMAKKQFKSRTELFIGVGFHDYFDQLFDLRSDVEHLHGLFSEEDNPPNREYRKKLFQLVIESEELARFCLNRFLQQRDLWQWFESDVKIEEFWKLLPSDRKNLWGASFDIKAFRQRLKLNIVKDSDLGI